MTSILLLPAAAGLVCLPTRSRRLMELANLAAFAATVGLGVQLFREVLARSDHVLTECAQFLRADALSAWMVLLILVVSLGTSLYAGTYFRRDLADGVVTPGRVKEFFVLTPLFTTGMFLVVLANNLGVMWFALEATALSSVLVALLASFCGILYQLSRILLGTPKVPRRSHASPSAGTPAMAVMLGALLLFSLWLPTPIHEVMQQAAGIIGGTP